ncbi:MAG: hypothetical protein ACI9S8_001563 [Chlamydiales bacterium]
MKASREQIDQNNQQLDLNKAAHRGDASLTDLNDLLEGFFEDSTFQLDENPEGAEHQLRQEIAQYDNIIESRDEVEGMKLKLPCVPFRRKTAKSKQATVLESRQEKGLVHRDVGLHELQKGHFIKRLLGDQYMSIPPPFQP